MTIALIIVAALLGLIATFSAFGKLSGRPDVVATLERVGVPKRRVPLLAILELLGAVGLLVGIWSKPVGVAASLGFVLYFLGAVLSHVRVKDKMKDSGPAAVLFLLSVATFVLELAR
jgi:uncharacterized membrane protein YphA (DoxX/SURF4 family)